MRPIGLRIGVAAPLGVAAAVLVGLTAGWPYAPATGWIVAAAVYLTWTWLERRRTERRTTPRDTPPGIGKMTQRRGSSTSPC